MMAFLLTVLTIVALLGGAVLLHVSLFAQRTNTTREPVLPVLQQEYCMEEGMLEELLSIGPDVPVSLLTQYARRCLVLLIVLVAAGVMAITLLFNYLR